MEQQLGFLDERPTWLSELRKGVKTWRDRSVFFGGSSWKYSGWLGQVYTRERYSSATGRFSEARFNRDCLSEYAEWFPTVCGDFSFYQFYDQPFWEKLFSQVPKNFLFGFKAPESITAPQFANHPRYGIRAGTTNEHFLDADIFEERFLRPLASFRDQIGYIVFEFPQFHRATKDTNAAFLQQLDKFLEKLPTDIPYSVEIRTKSLLSPHYFAVLRKHHVGHTFASWTHMPGLAEQLESADPFTSEVTVIRALLRPGRTYEQAVGMFQPYSEIKDPYPEGYKAVARVVKAAKKKSPNSRVHVAVNNRFAGSSIKTIWEILQELERHPV